MLILTRKKGQSILINDDIEIFISAIEGEQIKLGISAPKEVKIYRKELIEAVKENNREAAAGLKSIDKIREMLRP